ncbi:MAG: hypothetical protein ABEH65_09225 [Halobacteriales archaeon]
MGLIQKLKSAVGGGAEPNTYECADCGETFESYIDPDDHWVTCDHCSSREVEVIESGA